MINLIFGRKKSGKTEYVFRSVKTKLSADNSAKALIVVPDDMTFIAEKLVADKLGEFVTRVEVISLQRLAYRYIDKSIHRKKTFISPSGKNMLVYKIMTDLKQKLEVFRSSCDKMGFVSNLVSLFGEFGRYNVNVDDLKNLPVDTDSAFGKKLGEISLIYEAYNACFDDTSADGANNLSLLASLIGKNGLMGYTDIYFDAFSALTPTELAVIEAMAQAGANITVTLCYDEKDNEGIFIRAKKSIEEIEKISHKTGNPLAKPVTLNSSYITNAPLSHLEKSLYRYPVTAYDGECDSISLFKAATVVDESEYIAFTISNLVRNEGYRYRDISVYCADLAGFAPHLEKAFAKYGITYFTDMKESVSNHPIAVMLNNVLEIITGNFRYENVFAYLKTGFGGFRDRELYEFENYVLKAGVRGSIWTDDEKWQKHLAYAKNDDADYIERINSYREKFLAPVLKLKGAIRERSNIKDICIAITVFLNDIKAFETLNYHIEKLKADNDLVSSLEYRQVWNCVLDVLSQLVSLAGDMNVGVERFCDILMQGFDCYSISVIPAMNDAVTIGGANRLKASKTRAVFVAGMLEGAFPTVSDPDCIIGDDEREFMIKNGVTVMSDSRTKLIEERFRVYNLLTHADDKLFLSYPSATLESKATSPSTVLTQITEMFPHLTVKTDVFGDVATLAQTLVTPEQTFDRALFAAIEASVRPDEVAEEWAGIFAWYDKNDDWHSVFNRTLHLSGATNTERDIDPELVEKMYGDVIKGSATRIELFAKCPFAYFMQYGIKAKEREVMQLNPIDTGNVFHTVAEQFVNHVKDSGLAWNEITDTEIEDFCSKILDSLIDNSYFAGLFGENRYKNLKNRLYRIIKNSILAIKKHIVSGEFVPVGVEVTFDTNGDLDPITVTLPTGKKLLITGKIDRVDEAFVNGERYARIIDYKSSEHDIDLEHIADGSGIQLALYMSAYCENTGAKPAGMLYFRFSNPIAENVTDSEIVERNMLAQFKMTGKVLEDTDIIRAMDELNSSKIVPAKLTSAGNIDQRSSRTLSETTFCAIKDELEKVIRDIGEKIYRGCVQIAPLSSTSNGSACTYCAYKDICKFDPASPGNSYRAVPETENDNL